MHNLLSIVKMNFKFNRASESLLTLYSGHVNHNRDMTEQWFKHNISNGHLGFKCSHSISVDTDRKCLYVCIEVVASAISHPDNIDKCKGCRGTVGAAVNQ